MSKRNDNLRVLLLQYVQSVLEMANNVNTKNINQIVSLVKANVRVLENDVKESFNKGNYEDMGERVYN